MAVSELATAKPLPFYLSLFLSLSSALPHLLTLHTSPVPHRWRSPCSPRGRRRPSASSSVRRPAPLPSASPQRATPSSSAASTGGDPGAADADPGDTRHVEIQQIQVVAVVGGDGCCNGMFPVACGGGRLEGLAYGLCKATECRGRSSRFPSSKPCSSSSDD